MSRRPELLAATALYVFPLLLTSAFLASVGLGLLAGALLVIEASTAGLIAFARRRPPKTAQPTDGSTFLLLLGGGVVVAAVVLLVVVRLTS